MIRIQIAKILGNTLILLSFLASISTHAVPLTVSFDDPTDDFFHFNIDLTGMTLNFDNASGDYALHVFFDAANPFSGQYNVNGNFLNGSIDPLTTDPAFVGLNFIITSDPTTELVLRGNNLFLQSWSPGDQIANNSTIFGIPIDAPFISFLSGVSNRGQGIDILEPGQATVVPSQVPAPATAWLFGSAILGLVGVKRRKA